MEKKFWQCIPALFYMVYAEKYAAIVDKMEYKGYNAEEVIILKKILTSVSQFRLLSCI